MLEKIQDIWRTKVPRLLWLQNCFFVAFFIFNPTPYNLFAENSYIITIYDTVISSEAGDKVFEPGIFLFREVSRFF